MSVTGVKWCMLSDLDLGVSGEQVFDALRPFAETSPDPARFAREMALRRKRLFKRLARRIVSGWSAKTARSEEKVRTEYDRAWSAGLDRYDASRGSQSATPWIWNGSRLLVDAAGSARFRSLMIGAVIARLKPRTVLEVGCGDGINLALLSIAFPDVAFTGLELTETGHQTALALQRQARLPEALRNYAVLPIADADAFRRVTYLQGDATRMPFAPASFDLVFTVLSIEQMERVRCMALADIARVTGRHLLNLEPFRDVNPWLWRRLNVLSRDYYQGTVHGLMDHGLQPLWATDEFPQEVFLGSALVLSEKRQ